MIICGLEGTRTPYLCNANAALYQMSYKPYSVSLSRSGATKQSRAIPTNFIYHQLSVAPRDCLPAQAGHGPSGLESDNKIILSIQRYLS